MIAQLVQSSSSNHVKPSSKRIMNVFDNCLAFLNTHSVTKLNMWDLDSGGSRHMTRDKDVFLSLTSFNGGDIAFGCGDKSQITENGAVNIPDLPQLKNVSYVDGLRLTLINIC